MGRASVRQAGIVVGVALLFGACAPEAVLVSDTESWTLQLEQVDDGQPTQGQNAYPRRGTITVRLDLNRTSQPDPTCAGSGLPEITTVLASAHVLDARLQPETMGSFDGSWNCHGLTASLTLDDGTRYDLTSTDSDGDFGAYAPPGLAGDPTVYDHRWRSGSRRGYFRLLHDDHRTPALDSHMDVRVVNRTDRDLVLRYAARDDRILDPFVVNYAGGLDVAAGAIRLISWPSHPTRRDPTDDDEGPASYYWYTLAPGATNGATSVCFLSYHHPDLVEVDLLGVQRGECGEGWLGEMFIDARREHYLLPGATKQVQLAVGGLDSVWVRSSDPALLATVVPLSLTTEPVVTLQALPGLALIDHGVVVSGRNDATGDSVSVVLTVNLYDLSVTLHPDSVEVPPGSAVSAWFSIARRGVIASYMEVSFDPDTAGTPFADFLETWRFEPNPTLDTVSFLSFTVGQEQRTDRLRVCVRYAAIDDQCSPRELVVTVTPPPQLVMVKASAHNLLERVGTPAQALPAVRVADQADMGVSGVMITFRTADPNSGIITGATAVTDASGIATLGGWIFGTTAGTQTVIAEAPAGSTIQPLSLSFPVAVSPGPPSTMTIVAGNNQSAPAGSPVAVPPRLRVADRYGNRIGGIQVFFGIEAGGGSITGGQPFTGSDGEASVGSWTLGPTPGFNLLVAYVPGLSAGVQFAATGQ